MKLKTLSSSDPNEICNFIVENGYNSVMPKDLFERVDKLVEVGIRENPNMGQKLLLITREKRQMSRDNKYTDYYVLEQQKHYYQAWDKDKFVGSWY